MSTPTLPVEKTLKQSCESHGAKPLSLLSKDNRQACALQLRLVTMTLERMAEKLGTSFVRKQSPSAPSVTWDEAKEVSDRLRPIWLAVETLRAELLENRSAQANGPTLFSEHD